MTDFTLRPLTVPERKYTYTQSSQLQGQTGNIGYLRGDFGSSGDQFLPLGSIPDRNGKTMNSSGTWMM